MDVRRALWRNVACLALALAVLGSQGCSRSLVGASGIGEAARNYWVDRAKDLLDVVDVGFSFSEDPRFALYADGFSLVPVGFGLVDGYAAGIGGGNIGWMRFCSGNVGVGLWGYEDASFADFDANNVAGGNAQGVGLGGLATGPLGRPGWQPSCVHHVHLLWLGVFANANFLQAVDLALGTVGVDICGDDGYRYGLWPWESGLESSAAAEELRSQIFNPPTVQDRNNWSYCWGRCVSPLPVAATAAPAPAPKPPTEKK